MFVKYFFGLAGKMLFQAGKPSHESSFICLISGAPIRRKEAGITELIKAIAEELEEIRFIEAVAALRKRAP